MKLWRRLCFLVLAVSSTSRGQSSTTDSTHNEEVAGDPDPWDLPPRPESLNDTEHNSTHSTLPPPSSPSHVSENATDPLSTVITTGVETEDGGGSTSAPATTSASETEGAAVRMTTVPMATASSSAEPGTAAAAGGSSLGYVMMVLIFIVIIALCVILFFLRRASRTYSFDLQFPDPIINQFSEPIGTFEPVYLDDLAPNERVATSEPPVANGTSLQSEEKGSNGENVCIGLEPSPLSCDTSPSPGEDPADKTSEPPSSANLFFEDTGETQQNENNNNPSVCSSDPFVEINLDEPAWCDQLLTSPEATSSVLPFSPFSFSFSSSSSSSSSS